MSKFIEVYSGRCTGPKVCQSNYVREHQERVGFELRSTVLGHVQRGGAPQAYDRLLATRLGADAVEALEHGESDILVGMAQGQVSRTPFAEVVGRSKPIPAHLLALARALA